MNDFKYIQHFNSLDQMCECFNVLNEINSRNADLIWFAKDRDGNIHIFRDKPVKDETIGEWCTNHKYRWLDMQIPIVSWSDSEPIHIPKLLEDMRKEISKSAFFDE